MVKLGVPFVVEISSPLSLSSSSIPLIVTLPSSIPLIATLSPFLSFYLSLSLSFYLSHCLGRPSLLSHSSKRGYLIERHTQKCIVCLSISIPSLPSLSILSHLIDLILYSPGFEKKTRVPAQLVKVKFKLVT